MGVSVPYSLYVSMPTSMKVVCDEKIKSPHPCVDCNSEHRLPHQCTLVCRPCGRSVHVCWSECCSSLAAHGVPTRKTATHLLFEVLDVKVAPPVLRHGLDGRRLRRAAVVVGRRQLRHAEAEDAQALAHCISMGSTALVSSTIEPTASSTCSTGLHLHTPESRRCMWCFSSYKVSRTRARRQMPTDKHHQETAPDDGRVEALPHKHKGAEGPQHERHEQRCEDRLADPLVRQPQLLRQTGFIVCIC
jgi:hypothetical protein